MEQRARNFLNLTSRYYEKNKVKWNGLLRSVGLVFDEDVYNDTIIKVYDKLMNEEDLETTEDEVIAYWYQSFVNNIKRNKQYSCNSKRTDEDVIDLLKNEEYIIDSSNMYYPTIRYLLNKVREHYDLKSYHLFKMYYLVSEMTYDELNETIGCNVKTKINGIRKWLKTVIYDK